MPSSFVRAESLSERELKAKFLVNLMGFVHYEEQPESLLICTIDGDVTKIFIEELIASSAKSPISIASKTIRDDYSMCHMVYISPDYKNEMYIIMNKVQNKPILTVSDARSFEKVGGIMTFDIDSNSAVPTITVYMQALQRANIQLSSNLLNIVEIVY